MATRDELVAMNSKQLEEICGLIQKRVPARKTSTVQLHQLLPERVFCSGGRLEPAGLPEWYWR